MKTPSKSGHPVNSIPIPANPSINQADLQKEYRTYVGSLLWISQGTHTDLSTITNMLDKHQLHLTRDHIDAAKYAFKYLKSTKTKLLVSWHDFKKTPKSSELKNKIKQMSKFSSNVKIVSTAKSTYDSTRMLELYNSKGKNNLISFAMGDLGKISRILCLYLGSPYTYASLGKAVAPGQFSIDEVKKIINLKRSK
jgi:3-dehydroquinate dehydratase-1